jgi:hypothetical protein
MDAATQGEEATAKNSFCLEADYLHATLRLIDRTDFRCVSGSVRCVWAEGGSLSHTSDRRAIGEAGILHRYRPLGRIYLPGVCGQTPSILRRGAPGESGIVLSRYDGVDGYDWIAISLVPYLYAVERPEDVPLFAAVLGDVVGKIDNLFQYGAAVL